MNPITLNPDLFTYVLDEVIGQLNLYRTKELIDFAHRLRLVDRASNNRLERLTCRYLNIRSHDDLQRLMLAGVPNWEKHEWIRICNDQRQTAAIFDGFLQGYKNSTRLTQLVLDLRQLSAHELESHTRFTTCPGSVKELMILSAQGQTHLGYITFFLDSFLWNGDNLKLALCGIPTYSGIVTHDGHVTLALFLDESTEAYDVALLSVFARQFQEECSIRVVFAEDHPTAELEYLKQELLAITNDSITVEELVPEIRQNTALDWFADRVLDGSIWTVKGRPLTVMDIM